MNPFTRDCKQPASVYTVNQKDLFLALKIGPFRWVNYSPNFESNLAPLNQGQYTPIQSNCLGLIWTQRLKWAPVWDGIASWLSCFGINCDQMAPKGAESEYGPQGGISNLGLRQIFLIFSVAEDNSLAIIEWVWVECKELCRYRRLLSTEADNTETQRSVNSSHHFSSLVKKQLRDSASWKWGWSMLLMKTADISQRHHWFPREMNVWERVQKFHTYYGSLTVGSLIGWKKISTNQHERHPDLSSEASPVCNFCVRFSDVILWGNQWWRTIHQPRFQSAVYGSHLLNLVNDGWFWGISRGSLN